MSVADFVQNTALDVQTTITSLGAAFAGVGAEIVSGMVIRQLGGRAGVQQGLGGVGLNFVARAAICSVAYSSVATLMPATSQNVFFTIVFFASNQALVQDARTIAQMTLTGLRPFVPAQKPHPHVEETCACKQ